RARSGARSSGRHRALPPGSPAAVPVSVPGLPTRGAVRLPGGRESSSRRQAGSTAVESDTVPARLSRLRSVHTLRDRLREIVNRHRVARARVITSNDKEILEADAVRRTVLLLGGNE